MPNPLRYIAPIQASNKGWGVYFDQAADKYYIGLKIYNAEFDDSEYLYFEYNYNTNQIIHASKRRFSSVFLEDTRLVVMGHKKRLKNENH